MPLSKDEYYPSDEVAIMLGYDGTESKDTVKWCRKYSDRFPCRMVVALNQHYPEFKSGHYFNRNLVALVQKAIRICGLHLVIEDNYRLDGIVPIESGFGLIFADDYMLVTEALEVCGRLRIWESLGGKSAFYHDRILIEMLTQSAMANAISTSIREQCQSSAIAFIC